MSLRVGFGSNKLYDNSDFAYEGNSSNTDGADL